jgi:hypothetical protein
VVQPFAVQFVQVFFMVRVIKWIAHTGKQRNDTGVIQQFERFFKGDQLRPFHWTFWRTPIIPEP